MAIYEIKRVKSNGMKRNLAQFERETGIQNQRWSQRLEFKIRTLSEPDSIGGVKQVKSEIAEAELRDKVLYTLAIFMRGDKDGKVSYLIRKKSPKPQKFVALISNRKLGSNPSDSQLAGGIWVGRARKRYQT
ncbi:hypothetical protein [Parasphingorhabdus sp.]|uniref:hypothetical protein n=1 Tax=Parasphingorhabdus sp. TaxID=2709688 RepID=UPI0032658256